MSVLNGGIWLSYTETNSGLRSNYVSSISVDPQNNYWIGTNSMV
ncbi:MAG: hypothetical protein IPL98_02455 [Saprospiraceae bacterium]|nr:hypothetical protein [Saprospiraceae bacterium]